LLEKYVTGKIKSRGLKRVQHVVRAGEKKSAYRALVGNPERKKSIGKT
jgi:hypothetical protein